MSVLEGPHSAPARRSVAYKWIALSNTTLGILMAALNSSIILISLPAVFRGIGVNPLQPGEVGYLLWLLLGYMVITAVFLVTFGRISDMFGRVRMYNAGFAVFTLGSILLFWAPGHGNQAALELVLFRLVQGVGSAFLFANSAAIRTDAFPPAERGLAMGINQIAAIGGSLLGLIVGGLLASVWWRGIFLVSVPVGLVGTLWAYRMLRETAAIRRGQRIDYLGNITFALGLCALLVGVTYGIQPYGGHSMGWTNPTVLGELAVGLVLVVGFVAWERRSAEPMFRLRLFRIRAFTAGVLSSFLAAVARGGLMFMMIIWLQGIWLPEHGYSFTSTPLWAGIYMLPLTAGFLLAGPVSGILSDRFGARPFATGGMLGATASFVLLEALPIDFPYWAFALLILLNGLAMGAFASPNRAGIMNSLPPEHRGAGSGMNATFQNSAQVLSIGVFFTLVIIGLSSALPASMAHGLLSEGVGAREASRVAHLPPVSTLFAAFLGYNPMAHLLPAHVLHHLSQRQVAVLLGRSFFPRLIARPFGLGLRTAFDFAAAGCLVAAVASWARGGRPALAGSAPGR